MQVMKKIGLRKKTTSGTKYFAAILLLASASWSQPNRPEKMPAEPINLSLLTLGPNGEDFDTFKVTSLAWSPDGKLLAVGGEAEMSAPGFDPWSVGDFIQIWDVGKQRCRRVFGASPTGFNTPIAELAWATDGTFLTARNPPPPEWLTYAQTRNVHTGKAVTVKTEMKKNSSRKDWEATGTPHIVAGKKDFTLLRAERRNKNVVCLLERRNLVNGKVIATRLVPMIYKSSESVPCAALSNEGRQLALLTSAAKSVSVAIFDAHTAKPLRRFVIQKPPLPKRAEPLHRSQNGIYVSSFRPHLAFSRDASTLAATVGYQTVIVINARTGARQSIISTPSDIQSYAISSNGTLLATREAGRRLTLWNARTGQLLRKLSPWDIYSVSLGDSNSEYLHTIAFSPDSTMLAVASGYVTVALWRVN